MVREDILEGLRSAVSKGESLKQAMISFYNAGYKREEIQEAAQALQEIQLTQGIQPQAGVAQPQTVQQQVAQPSTQPPTQPVVQPQIQQPQPGKTVQRVSKYGKKKGPGTTLIIVLAIFLALLLGILAVIFIFKDQLTNILNNLI